MSPGILGDAAYQAVPNPTYRFVRALGGHGPGTLALNLMEHLGFGELCVQKTILATGMPPDVAFREPRILDKFRDDELFVPVREAQFDIHPGAVTWVMPYFPDGSARDALAAGYRFPLEDAVAVICDLLDAISTLQAQENYVHGDIKTAQMLLRHGRTRSALADFGSAVKLDSSGTGPMVGPTWVYTAPEVLARGRVSLASDTFSAALSAFEVLCGPFDFVHLILPLVLGRLTAGQSPIPPAQMRWQPHVPKAMRRIINRALSLDPGRRPSPSQLRDRLRRSITINWRRVDANLGPQGTWEGTWPITRALTARSSYRVTCTPLRKGGFDIAITQQVNAGGPLRAIPRFGGVKSASAAAAWKDLAIIFSRLESLVRQAKATRR